MQCDERRVDCQRVRTCRLTVHSRTESMRPGYVHKCQDNVKADRHFNIYRYPDGKLGSFLPKFCRRGVKVMVDDIPEETAAEWAWRMMLEVSSSVGMQADEVVFEGALD